MRVGFYEIGMIDENLMKYAVIGCRYDGKWIFVRHEERTTWEIPGGRREPNEPINDTAARELKEETGATRFEIHPIVDYEVYRADEYSYGRLFYAEVFEIGELNPDFEIEEIMLGDELPENLTYKEIQPHLQKVIEKYEYEFNINKK